MILDIVEQLQDRIPQDDEFRQAIGDRMRKVPTAEEATAMEEEFNRIVQEPAQERPLEVTKGRCAQCEADDVLVVQLGEEDYYESATAWVCEACLWKALEAFEEVKDRK